MASANRVNKHLRIHKFNLKILYNLYIHEVLSADMLEDSLPAHASSQRPRKLPGCGKQLNPAERRGGGGTRNSKQKRIRRVLKRDSQRDSRQMSLPSLPSFFPEQFLRGTSEALCGRLKKTLQGTAACCLALERFSKCISTHTLKKTFTCSLSMEPEGQLYSLSDFRLKLNLGI